jgi:hypothetical protein
MTFTSFNRRSWLALAALPLLAAGVAWAAGTRFDFTHFGHFDRMTRTGDTRGQVKLSDLPQAAGSWGVGALSSLRGEVLLHDGRLLVSRGHDEKGRTEAPRPHDEAALFAGAKVLEWVDVAVPGDMPEAAFEAFVAEQARARGLSLDEPFVFLVDGSYPALVWHVVTGAPPAGGHGSGHGAGSGGHANTQSDLRVFDQAGSRGRLLGVYSGARLEGVVSHAGERFHVHYADVGLNVSGHVDAYSVARGATLRLPVR